MFRQQFMTIDPAPKFGSRGDLDTQGNKLRNFQELRIEDQDQVLEEQKLGRESGHTLDIARLISESRGRLPRDKVGIPRPSLMKGKSEYTYHLNETRHAG